MDNLNAAGKALFEEIKSAPPIPDSSNAKIAYQGIKGANSHDAALKLFPGSELKDYPGFADVFEAVESGECAFGILPVENSTAGSVSTVFDLILKYRFYIVKVLGLPIDHCLAGLRQAEFSDIEKVISHPQALSQCAEYTEKHGFQTFSWSNTAVAARDTAKEKRINLAAICSPNAAKEYGLKILDNHIQDNPYNSTRFIVISKKLFIDENANKVSLCFSLPHESGSLYAMLGRFNDLGLNLTKIESRPIPGKEFRYLFYLDFTGSVKSEGLTQLLCGLCVEVPEFSFLGNYEEISAFDEEK